MADFVEALGLHVEGFTDAQIAQIDAIKPDVDHLANLVKSEWPRITRVIAVAQMVARVIAQHQETNK